MRVSLYYVVIDATYRTDFKVFLYVVVSAIRD